ncbi:hypothetical protein [Pontibacter actiniarum]|uniref:hypothetical protein n=1 Tax=Pontibacter actiniarum TaxID=323450 RepID=UPI00041EED58|nr:hypothetical protein [Pontibacter actiniarum]
MNLRRLLRDAIPSRKQKTQNENGPKAFHPFTSYTYGAAFFCALLLNTACQQEQEANSATVATPPPAPADTAFTAEPAAVAADSAAAPQAEVVLASSKAEKTAAWTYPGPEPLPGAILPQKRIVAFYGNPLSRRMGILGELPPEEMLAKLDEEVANWTAADSLTPVQPALHVIVVTAQGQPGRAGKYRLRMTNKMIDDVLAMAKQRDAIVFLDVQVGQSTLQEELPQLADYLKLPNVHLGIDAEFSMKDGGIPGRSIGTFDAADINYATQFLADMAKEHQLPPKLLIVHRFTQRMITNYDQIELRPEVQVVMHMDGWGHPALKKDTYRRYIQKEPVQFTGFKLFYKNDLRKSPRLMEPEEILALQPTPLYIQYQ